MSCILNKTLNVFSFSPFVSFFLELPRQFVDIYHFSNCFQFDHSARTLGSSELLETSGVLSQSTVNALKGITGEWWLFLLCVLCFISGCDTILITVKIFWFCLCCAHSTAMKETSLTCSFVNESLFIILFSFSQMTSSRLKWTPRLSSKSQPGALRSACRF